VAYRALASELLRRQQAGAATAGDTA